MLLSRIELSANGITSCVHIADKIRKHENSNFGENRQKSLHFETQNFRLWTINSLKMKQQMKLHKALKMNKQPTRHTHTNAYIQKPLQNDTKRYKTLQNDTMTMRLRKITIENNGRTCANNFQFSFLFSSHFCSFVPLFTAFRNLVDIWRMRKTVHKYWWGCVEWVGEMEISRWMIAIGEVPVWQFKVLPRVWACGEWRQVKIEFDGRNLVTTAARSPVNMPQGDWSQAGDEDDQVGSKSTGRTPRGLGLTRTITFILPDNDCATLVEVHSPANDQFNASDCNTTRKS